eukprot:4191911-Prymnesium_polylepis.2
MPKNSTALRVSYAPPLTRRRRCGPVGARTRTAQAAASVRPSPPRPPPLCACFAQLFAAHRRRRCGPAQACTGAPALAQCGACLP